MAEVTLLTAGVEHGHHVPAFVFLATVSTYNYHRLFRGRGVRVPTHTDRHRWIARHRKGLWGLSLAAGAGVVWSGLHLSRPSLLLVAPFGLVALFYSVLPFGRRARGIRDVPFAKVFLVALTWAAVTAALPLVEVFGSHVPWTTLLAECASRFFFILALTIPFDVRDLSRDDPTKRTIPQIVGVTGAKIAALGFLTAFVAIAQLRTDPGHPPGVAIGISAALTAGLILGVSRPRPELYYTGWLESMMVVQYLAVRIMI